jgi:subtilase family serine protease
MKKILTSLIFLAVFMIIGHETFACNNVEYPTTIDGPSDIELDNATATTSAGYQFSMNMSPGYRSALSGYKDTEWTIDGVVVGYGENLTLSTVGWTRPYGTFTLVGSNMFGVCYGCGSNEVFTKQITFSPHRPDLIVSMLSVLPSTLPGGPATFQLSFKVTNQGTLTSPGVGVKTYFTRTVGNLTTESAATNDVTLAIPPGGTYTVNSTTVYSPYLSVGATSEDWTLTLYVDPQNYIAEQNETNNKAEYSKTISNGSKKYFPQSDLNLSTASTAKLILVTDLSGNAVWKKGGESFDISQLKRGIYVFQTQDGNKIEFQKILKE